MRIISGRAKGKRLSCFKDRTIRPTSDMLRETLFNVIDRSLPGACFLDLFAGSGAIGIEALSRKAGKVVFADHNLASLKLIRKNLESCKLNFNYQCLRADFRKAIEILNKKKEEFDFIFIDPPYFADFYEKCLERLSAAGILKNYGAIIMEHFFKKIVPQNYAAFYLERQIRSGDSVLSFYRLRKN